MRFFMLDKITGWQLGKAAAGIKNVAFSEDFFNDHFPRHPIMPGVLILESLAQLAGLLLEASVEKEYRVNIKAILTLMERTKFRQIVKPGDVLNLQVEINSLHQDSGKVKVKALVENKIVAESAMIFIFTRFSDPELEQKRAKLLAYWLEGLK